MASLQPIDTAQPSVLPPIDSARPSEASIFDYADRDEKWFETLRDTEYAYLDAQHHKYLDFTGSGLASTTQLRSHQERLTGDVCGNPHSSSPTSLTATELVEETRRRILQHFNADPAEYAVIFTSNASNAAKIIGESYPFSPFRRLVLTFDNHNSVNGLREYAKKRHCRTSYVPCRYPDMHFDPVRFDKTLKRHGSRMFGASAGLCAFPAQSNFSGVRQSLDWVAKAQSHGFDVLLDVAAYVPTSDLDLSKIKPEYLMVSWYKVFGFPTGVGCLLAKKTALKELKRPWFSGGTVEAVSVGIPWHKLTVDESAFEDGTLNFHGIPDVLLGLDWVQKIGISAIHNHVDRLTEALVTKLMALKHTDGSPMITLYGPDGIEGRGACVSFNILDCRKSIVDERIVGEEAASARISLRTGCFCNPGVGEDIFQLKVKTLRSLLWATMPTIDEYIHLLKLPSAGAIRVSFGIPSTMQDVNHLLHFIETTYRDRAVSSEGLPPRTRC